MRLGYSFWGFMADVKLARDGSELSTPDGNATYSWSIVREALRRDWTVYQMQEDRDEPAHRRLGDSIFAAFSQADRAYAYGSMIKTHGQSLPELDVLLLEWRFPIADRNCRMLPDGLVLLPPSRSAPDFDTIQPDLFRQIELLQHYSQKKTKIVLWDLDHKLTIEGERFWLPHSILETSAQPRKLFRDRTRVEPPTIVSSLLQHHTLPSDLGRKLVYVGSRYERDDVIEEWIRPVSERWPGAVHFYGNWTRPENLREAVRMWPRVNYCGRITTSQFWDAYGTAAACPLLAKRSYLETGFITPRIWEALLFGTIPVGLVTHRGIDRYLPDSLVARDPGHLGEIVERLAGISLAERHALRREIVGRIGFMDAGNFVDVLER